MYQWKRVMSGKEVAAMLENNGWKFIVQEGSHMKYRKNGINCPVPNHKEIKKGTIGNIKRIVRQCEELKT